jgi:hypothetical protein
MNIEELKTEETRLWDAYQAKRKEADAMAAKWSAVRTQVVDMEREQLVEKMVSERLAQVNATEGLANVRVK